METSVLNLPEREYLLPGNRTCAGCGLSIAYRYILKALEGNAIVAVPASCLTVLHGMYPTTSVLIPCVNVAFPSTAASASGLVAGLKALGRTDITVVGFAGDGGTHDIGIQALSGAAERGADFIYICYDNEAYMNTGTQRSSSTPLGAKTATTPVLGKQQHLKDMPRIMEAHSVSYIATACPSYPADLYDKMRKAKTKKGTRYIHISTPCPPGWIFPTKDTVKMGRLAVETGMVTLYEMEDGVFRLTGRSRSVAERGKLKPVGDYIKLQGRFAGISADNLKELQTWVNSRWAGYLKRA
ncbi:MAG: pyruvate synthase subunit beta [Chloroflexi bacterium]|jgi:pyruvate ferredoxin oxidoreductase beta subunit|nr:pyruvate synthase subunit beta [Chloroflexota bacterium]